MRLKAGWNIPTEKAGPGEPAKKEIQAPRPEQLPSAEKTVESPPKVAAAEPPAAKAATPEKVNVLVRPHEEQGAMFTIDGSAVSRLRTDLERLTEKKL